MREIQFQNTYEKDFRLVKKQGIIKSTINAKQIRRESTTPRYYLRVAKYQNRRNLKKNNESMPQKQIKIISLCRFL